MLPYAKKSVMMFFWFARVQTTEKFIKLTRHEENVTPVLTVRLRDRGRFKPW